MPEKPDFVCGQRPDNHDPSERRDSDTCSCGGALMHAYGLAAGGIGNYSICEDCGRFWNAKPDNG